MNVEKQSYANHRRLHPPYHYLLTLLTLAMFVGAVIGLVRSFLSGNQVFPALLVLIISISFTVILVLVRTYPLKAQDRAIRAEENLRHFVLTQKLLDPRLGISQIVALRFASDEEFPSLCQRAAAEQLSPDAIKKSIREWRDDNFRI